jgi:hypothetical protein
MLIIPLYKDFRHGAATDSLAIAHPFVYQQGEDIESQLTSFGQRENLRRLIVWVPGYFPGSIQRVFTWVPIIKGQRMIVLELQPCVGAEAGQINGAMKTLLEGDILVVEWIRPKRPSPPYTNELRMTPEAYHAGRLVRSNGYDGRYFNHEFPVNQHLLWAFDPGTRIINRLSDEEKRTVAAFAAEVIQEGKGEAG